MGWRLFDTKENSFFLFVEVILSFAMKMHCRIQKCLHGLINTQMHLTSTKRKIYLPSLFSSPLKLNQRFKTLRPDIPAIVK